MSKEKIFDRLERELLVFKNPQYAKVDRKSGIARKVRALAALHSSKYYSPAIVKITSSSRSSQQVKNHLEYISRKGELNLKDPEGVVTTNRDDVSDLVDEWSVFDSSDPAKNKDGYVVRIRYSKEALGDIKSVVKNELSDLDIRIDLAKNKKGERSINLRVRSLGSDLAPERLDDVFSKSFDVLDIRSIQKQSERHTVNVMVSSPRGSNPKDVESAAHAFAKQEFADKGFDYVLALHTDTDFPHCHICVKATNFDGRKLQTYKADLQRFREVYAEKARDRGIMIEASSAKDRGRIKDGQRQSYRHLKDRYESFAAYAQAKPERLVDLLIEKHVKDPNRKVTSDVSWIGHICESPDQLRQLSTALGSHQAGESEVQAKLKQLQGAIDLQLLVAIEGSLGAREVPVVLKKITGREALPKNITISILSKMNNPAIVEQLRSLAKAIPNKEMARDLIVITKGVDKRAKAEFEQASEKASPVILKDEAIKQAAKDLLQQPGRMVESNRVMSEIYQDTLKGYQDAADRVRELASATDGGDKKSLERIAELLGKAKQLLPKHKSTAEKLAERVKAGSVGRDRDQDRDRF
jgi:hypothetical protein